MDDDYKEDYDEELHDDDEEHHVDHTPLHTLKLNPMEAQHIDTCNKALVCLSRSSMRRGRTPSSS